MGLKEEAEPEVAGRHAKDIDAHRHAERRTNSDPADRCGSAKTSMPAPESMRPRSVGAVGIGSGTLAFCGLARGDGVTQLQAGCQAGGDEPASASALRREGGRRTRQVVHQQADRGQGQSPAGCPHPRSTRSRSPSAGPRARRTPDPARCSGNQVTQGASLREPLDRRQPTVAAHARRMVFPTCSPSDTWTAWASAREKRSTQKRRTAWGARGRAGGRQQGRGQVRA